MHALVFRGDYQGRALRPFSRLWENDFRIIHQFHIPALVLKDPLKSPLSITNVEVFQHSDVFIIPQCFF